LSKFLTYKTDKIMEGCELTEGKTVMLLAEYGMGVEVDVVNGISVTVLKCVAACHYIEIKICIVNIHKTVPITIRSCHRFNAIRPFFWKNREEIRSPKGLQLTWQRSAAPTTRPAAASPSPEAMRPTAVSPRPEQLKPKQPKDNIYFHSQE
jgi:hypothetical protein